MSDSPDVKRRRLFVCLGAVSFLVVCGTIGVAFMPMLLARAPLALVALSPLFRHVVMASPSVDALPLFAIVVPRHFAPDPFMYLLGREYGPVAVGWMEANSPGMGKTIRSLERLFAKVGPLALLLSPDLLVSTLAGAARVPAPLFVAMNLVGTVGMVVVARWFGAVLEGPIQAMTRFFSAHLLQVTVASVLIVLAVQWWSRRSGKGPGAT